MNADTQPFSRFAGGDGAESFADIGPRHLRIGSLNEIADLIAAEIEATFGGEINGEPAAPFAFQKIWSWNQDANIWVGLDPVKLLRPRVKEFDGATFFNDDDGGKSSGKVRLDEKKIQGVIGAVCKNLEDDDFFEAAPVGIACLNGFLKFCPDGEISVEPHSPTHLRRFLFPSEWNPAAVDRHDGFAIAPGCSLFSKLIDGCFAPVVDEDMSDAEMVALDQVRWEKTVCLQELFGAVALELGPKRGLHEPAAFFLEGTGAGNGKSTWIDLLREVVPPHCRAVVHPHDWGDPFHRVGLEGISLNAVDELRAAAITSSEEYKTIVFGEETKVRNLNQPFRPMKPRALHVFGTNYPVKFVGGVGPGEARRSNIIRFQRSIPVEERVAGLARRIVREEGQILLAWTVSGAQRVLSAGAFTAYEALMAERRRWANDADVVRDWLGAGNMPAEWTSAALLYDNFINWLREERILDRGAPIDKAGVSVKQFSQKLTAIAESSDGSKEIEKRKDPKGRMRYRRRGG